MTFDATAAGRHAAVLLADDSDAWDDPETEDADADADDELEYRDADEEETFTESGDQGEDA
jgi:hypothetical protein